jgi:hypothetical protein
MASGSNALEDRGHKSILGVHQELKPRMRATMVAHWSGVDVFIKRCTPLPEYPSNRSALKMQAERQTIPAFATEWNGSLSTY